MNASGSLTQERKCSSVHSCVRSLVFPCIPGLELVPVPYDLENEPYTSTDTKIRPDLQTTRPYFHYAITDDGSVSIRVGHIAWDWNEPVFDKRINSASLPSKRCSYVSAVDVYEKYGLTVVHSYLKRAYSNPLTGTHPWWFSMYCIASLYLVERNRASSLLTKMNHTPAHLQDQVGLLACSSLLSFFQLEDKLRASRWPIVTESEHSPSLEAGLLALICNSKRISREITSHVLVQRQTREMREGEMEYRAKICSFRCSSGVTCSLQQERLVLEKRDQQGGTMFHLYHVHDIIKCTPLRMDIISHSPSDVSRVLGLTEQHAWSKMLPELRSDLSDELLSAWVLLLLFRRDRVEGLRQTSTQLSRDELERLFRELL